MTSAELRAKLAQFYGGDVLYKHSINPGFKYTEGAQCFAEEAGAYWFLDIIATEMNASFASIALEVNKRGRTELRVEDGNGGALWRKRIKHTYCPVGIWRFFCVNSVLMLPSEY